MRRQDMMNENDHNGWEQVLEQEWGDSNEKPLSSYAPCSRYRAEWKCARGHIWYAPISNRRMRGDKCPYCSGRKVYAGFNDLLTIRPDIAKEWNWEKNSKSPSEYTSGSSARVWWKCQYGHEWQAHIARRTGTRSSGCPVCKKRLPDKDSNNLAVEYPDIAAEWDYEKNIKRPEDYRPHSNEIVWWKCQRGHSWSARINDRTRKTKCPYCTGRLAIKGETDFKTMHPSLASEWDFERNTVDIDSVSEYSNRKVWWICPKGHHYQARIDNRAYGYDCPICYGRKKV